MSRSAPNAAERWLRVLTRLRRTRSDAPVEFYEEKKKHAMNERSRIILAFAFNFLLPGLGFHYSGTRHNVMWLRRLGLVTMVVFLFAFPIGVAILWPYARIDYYFTLQELAACLTLILISAFLGASIKQKVSKRGKP